MAHIWQYGRHNEAKPAQGLQWSRRLRHFVAARLRLGGAKVSTIQKGYFYSSAVLLSGFIHSILYRISETFQGVKLWKKEKQFID